MGLIVDNEYYGLVLENYMQQIDRVEQSIEDFKSQCDTLFSNNFFGTYLQEVLQEIYINFYECVKEQLNTAIAEAITIEESFATNIDTDDKL